MPGWSWWLIWAVLVVALVLVVVFGIRRVLAAYRRARVEGDRLNGLLGQLTASVDELSDAGRRVEDQRTSALFGSRGGPRRRSGGPQATQGAPTAGSQGSADSPG